MDLHNLTSELVDDGRAVRSDVACSLCSARRVLERFSSWVHAARGCSLWAMQLGRLQLTFGVQFASVGRAVRLRARCSARCTTKVRRGRCLHAQGINGSAGTLEVNNDARLAVRRRTYAFRKVS